MNKIILLFIALSSSSLAADNLICGADSCTLVDSSGTKWRAEMAFTTNGNGDIFTLGDVASNDNIIGVNTSSNRTLIDNLSRRWSASVVYTTDGNGHVIPIPTPSSGGGATPTPWPAQAANTIFAGGASASATPAFRNLVSADIPTITSSKISDFSTASKALFSATAPIVDTSGVFSCLTASGSQAGCLSSTDWSTFNGKQSALTTSSNLSINELTLQGQNYGTTKALSISAPAGFTSTGLGHSRLL